MTKTEHKLYLGKCDYNRSGRRNCKAYLSWSYDGVRFSAQAEIWNPQGTDIYCGGQCVDSVVAYFPHNNLAHRIRKVWNKWHLNDLTAGLPEQENEVGRREAEESAKHEGKRGHSLAYALKFDSHYSMACAWLKEAGLYEIPLPIGATCTGGFPEEVQSGKRGYRYGERWILTPIPEEVKSEILSWVA